MSASPERAFNHQAHTADGETLKGVEALTRAELSAMNRKLMTIALSLTDKHVAKAKDLVQETFERALKSKHTFQEGGNLEAWLATILRNQYYSSNRRAKFWDTEDPETRMREMSVSAEQDGEIDSKQIDALLEKLPERFRIALQTVRDGGDYEEVGHRVGLKPESLKSLMNRARKAFAKVLYDAGYIDSDDELVERFLDKEVKKRKK
ncbi:MAG TPA: sigma-70 family RNA polymerase sigma factor [Candidatus Paceibacterota bacterium]|nr:sigma-70 family RNA polymerase sigma factor [Candidatus Paceibacterota bacterium]